MVLDTETVVSTETSSDAVNEKSSDDAALNLSDAQQSEEGAGTAEETKGTEADAASQAETDPESRRAELQSRLDGEGDPLSSTEKEELKRLDQSYRDRQNVERLKREAKQQEQAEISKAIRELPNDIAMTLGLNLSGGSAEDELAIRKIGDAVAQKLGKVSAAVLNTLEANLRSQLKGAMPQALHSQLDSSGYDELLQMSWDYQMEVGKKSSDAAKQVTKLQKENGELKAEIERLKGGRAASGAASSEGRPASKGLTKEAWARMTKEERAQAWIDTPDEVRAL